MMREHTEQRALELLAEQATEGLEPRERAELRLLLLQHPSLDSESFERAAAAIAMAAAQADLEEMPGDLYRRLEQQSHMLAETNVDDGFAPMPSPVAEMRSWKRALGSPWLGLATAATLLLSLGWFIRYANTPIETKCMLSKIPVVAQVRETEELMQAADVRVAAWQAADETLAASLLLVKGEVAWSSMRQEGVVHIAGLQTDEMPEELHLWIIDPSSGDLPIDGGTFAIDRSGDVVVALKLQGKGPIQPARFLLTFEDPSAPPDPAHLEPILVASIGDSFSSAGSGA